ncbi:methylated-DNA--protein-cysteine methyltransferase [Shewanella algicola]|uniref:Methylated-DNA--protein-cysteine methyltransferase n=1 Tax=Shewanella algicola TaxID=640633 RepID=A0A9X2CDZ7_9GAMM|nr:methylated-DNA--[protein]-cysteine S-methyltransferase [Shewanella algicola]MCL1105941.1 methylated-DNA--[protein]-cysteine S-methyltransferase [Shewanella algicola]GGP53218.1 methylated-DNA--protein-cysteine methyltransferase [Shewanella algicola]
MSIPQVQSFVSSPVGLLSLKASEYGLTHLQVSDLDELNPVVVIESSIKLMPATNDACLQAQQHINDTVVQLTEYFAGIRQTFDIPLAPKGTVFQQQVWQALRDLPFGQHCSYSDIANTIGRPKAVRAVGAANGANPIAIIVPCHRVIGKGGKLTGYAYGLGMKQWLLNLETAQ